MCLGFPGQVVEVLSDDFQLALVDVLGERRAVNTGLVADGEPLTPGDWVLVHTGFAVERLDPARAADALGFLREVGTNPAPVTWSGTGAGDTTRVLAGRRSDVGGP